jgi:hypothetical protein
MLPSEYLGKATQARKGLGRFIRNLIPDSSTKGLTGIVSRPLTESTELDNWWARLEWLTLGLSLLHGFDAENLARLLGCHIDLAWSLKGLLVITNRIRQQIIFPN